jgi:hypothetical protein
MGDNNNINRTWARCKINTTAEHVGCNLKGQCHGFSTFGFFHKSVSSKPPSIPLGPFQILKKFAFAEIFAAQGASTVLLTQAASGKIFNQNSFNYFVWTPLRSCAADAAIWAEQQLIAIPGWLREDQNARLHQEEHFASIKEPRSPTTKENKAKRRTICC